MLDRLAQLFGPTTLYTLVDDGRPLTDAIAACDVVTSPLQRLPGAAGRWRRYYLPLMPWAVGRLHVEPCEMLISTSSAVMKSITPPAGARHICYCHSPARYLWDLSDDYAHGAGGRVRTLGLRAMRQPFQRWDRRTADRVDVFVANSRFTAERIRRCYGRDSRVIHPPVRTDTFTPGDGGVRDNALLVVSALEPYKRVDLVIDAANRAKIPLTVAGDGSQRRALAERAGPTVTMLGRVSDDELIGLYRRARAMVFPQCEDFGITAVEAQACGCPVIAFGAGGAVETVTPSTGVLFDEQTVESLLSAIDAFDAAGIDPADCRANAERFSEAVFDQRMRAIVDECAPGGRTPPPRP